MEYMFKWQKIKGRYCPHSQKLMILIIKIPYTTSNWVNVIAYLVGKLSVSDISQLPSSKSLLVIVLIVCTTYKCIKPPLTPTQVSSKSMEKAKKQHLYVFGKCTMAGFRWKKRSISKRTKKLSTATFSLFHYGESHMHLIRLT